MSPADEQADRNAMSPADEQGDRKSGWRSAVSWLLPLAVSIGAIAFLLTRVDFAAALSHVDARVAAMLAPAMAAYGALTLWFEGLSIRLLVPPSHRLGTWTCAKIKAASYPLALLHYGLGAAGLTYLLRHRAGMSLSQAAGAVLLIALLDLSLLLVLSAFGAAFVASEAPAVRGGLVAAAVVGMVLGFGFLRAPVSLGPLERLRQLGVFLPARQAPMRLLVELGALRLMFVLLFVALASTGLVSFGVHVPWPDLMVGITVVALVAALPIAVAGLGTGQVAFVFVFGRWSDPETLLACSLTLSAGMIAMRAAIGAVFAREYAREAFVAVREAEA